MNNQKGSVICIGILHQLSSLCFHHDLFVNSQDNAKSANFDEICGTNRNLYKKFGHDWAKITNSVFSYTTANQTLYMIFTCV